jgi:3-oxoacyl-[acyl-carrier protein] reductase
MDLAGRVVVVTGGTGGLGSRMCHAFARQGARIAVVYLERTARAEALAAELQTAGAAEARVFQADVTQADQIARLVEQVTGAWDQLDVLINNAAFNESVRYEDLDGLTQELWEKILYCNVTGPFLMCKAVAPVMKRQGNGRIVNISSVAGFYPGGSSIAYAVSKAALAHLTRCMAVALAPEVLVNGVAPGLMEGTRMTEKLLPDLIARSNSTALLQRAADKEDVADQVVTLVRTDSTTGQNVVIDAGRFFH